MADDQREHTDVNEQVPAVAAPSGGFWKSILEIFTDPFKVFARIDAGLSWWKPYVFMSILTMVVGYLMLPFNQKAMRIAFQARSPEHAEQTAAQMNKFGFVGLIMIPIGIIIFTLIIAGIVHVIINIMSRRSSFKKTLGLIFYCGVISLPGQIIGALVIMSRGIESVESTSDATMSFSLAPLFPEVKGVLAALMRSFGIFEIWYYVVLVLGIAVVFKISRKKAIFAAIPSWLFAFLGALLGGKFQGGAR
jgi:hypothetical protein